MYASAAVAYPRSLRAIPYTLTSFLVPVAGARQLAPVNWRACHATGTRMSLVPVGFNIAHLLFVCRQLTPLQKLAPATGTRNCMALRFHYRNSLCTYKGYNVVYVVNRFWWFASTFYDTVILYSLTSDLLQPFQQCPLTWWIFLPSFIKITLLTTEISRVTRNTKYFAKYARCRC